MKLALSLSVALTLTWAPAAYAQASCSEIARISSEALDDFDAIAGENIEGDLHKTSVWLSGASDCSINYEYDSVYSCMYQFDSYAAASAAWSGHQASVGACLAGWTANSLTPESAATDGYRVLSGTLYVGSGDYVDTEWAVVLEEHTDTNGTHYHVWVELAYYWF